MKTALILGLCLLAGCGPGCFTNISDTPQKAVVVKPSEWQTALRSAEEVIAAKQDESIVILKENTTALAAIKSQVEDVQSSLVETRQAVGTMEAKLVVPQLQVKEVIKSAVEPQEATRANLSQPIIPVASPPAVRLFITHAPFHCPPCERLKRAVTNGEFDGFEVVDGGDFSGLRSYPAIRFETPTTATGWGVVYGYDNSTIPTLRALTQGTSAPTTGAIFPLQAAAQVGSPRFAFRSVSRWIGFGGRSRTSARSSCSSGSCR